MLMWDVEIMHLEISCKIGVERRIGHTVFREEVFIRKSLFFKVIMVSYRSNRAHKCRPPRGRTLLTAGKLDNSKIINSLTMLYIFEFFK